MKVQIDSELCSGHGRCYSLAPGVYDADNEGYGRVLHAEVPAGLEDQARQGARNCPERAITIED